MFNKTVKILSALLLLITISSQSIQAVENRFFSTITFSIGFVGTEGLTYDESRIVGEYTTNLVRYKNIAYLTNDRYKRRVFHHYERVSLPPFSEVDIGYYWFNNTPEPVDVETIRVPLSRENPKKGDVTNLVYDIGFQEGITCSTNKCRAGKYLDIDGVGILESGMYEDTPSGVVISTLKIMPAVEITKYEIEYLDKYNSKVLIYVQNNTGKYLEDIRINYKTIVDRIMDFEPYEQKVLELYKKCVLSEHEINCGSMTIYDNNSDNQCIVYGSPWDSYSTPDSISVFSKIGDQWLLGAQTQPEIESFCIERIPYTYTTKDMVVDFQPEEPEITQREYWQELLNIDILPITSYQFVKLDRYLTLLKPLGIDSL